MSHIQLIGFSNHLKSILEHNRAIKEVNEKQTKDAQILIRVLKLLY